MNDRKLINFEHRIGYLFYLRGDFGERNVEIQKGMNKAGRIILLCMFVTGAEAFAQDSPEEMFSMSFDELMLSLIHI